MQLTDLGVEMELVGSLMDIFLFSTEVALSFSVGLEETDVGLIAWLADETSEHNRLCSGSVRLVEICWLVFSLSLGFSML